MITRRTVLQAGLTAGAATLTGRAWAEDGAPTMKTPVAFDMPAGATDCHVHVIPDTAQFPFSPGRTYSPPTATATQLLALQQAMHMDRVVVVTPSVYSTDNAATLDALLQLGPSRARGVAVAGDSLSAAELDRLHDAGIRGLRLNLETAGVFNAAVAAERLDRTAKLIEGRGWHIEMYTRPAVIAALASKLAALPVPVLFDHFAGAQAAAGVEQPGFAALIELLGAGKVYVTMSGAYRASSRMPDYPDVVPLAKALIAANPERLVWGSDWPHPNSDPAPGRKPTDTAPPLPIDDGGVLNLLATWAPDAAVRHRILVDNPKQLYGF